MGFYSIKKINGKRKKVWFWNRSRGLEKAKENIGDLEKEIKILLKKNDKIKILEIGCGYGRVLLELKKIYGDKIETYGINKEPNWDTKIIKQYGVAERIFNKDEIKKNLPKISICNVDKKIPYPHNYFDLIFSQRAIQYIHDKAKFLEELNRIISAKGLIITSIENYPKSRLKETPNRWEIWHKNKKISIYSLLSKKKNIRLFKEKGYPKDKYIQMKKDKNFNMNLKLVSSFNLHDIYPEIYGTKSKYILKNK